MARHHYHRKSRSRDDTLILIAIFGVLGWFYWRPLWAAIKPGLPWILGVLPIAGVLGMVMIAARRQGQRHRNQALLDVARMSRMSGIEFEQALKVLFEAQGYHVRLTPKTGDFGADLLLRKAGKLTVTQAKRYKENVGIVGIQEVIGAREYYHADAAMVVTTAGYTRAAKALAAEAHVTLWSRAELAAAVAASAPKTKEGKAHAGSHT